MRCDRKFSPIIGIAIAVIIGIEALFLGLPVQRAYLLPMLPFVLILLGIAMKDRSRALLALTILIASYNFVSINLARPDVPDHATRARFGIFLEPGYLLDDLASRRRSRGIAASPPFND